MCQAHMAGWEVLDDRVMGYPVGRNVTAKGMNADLEVDPLRLSAFAVAMRNWRGLLSSGISR